MQDLSQFENDRYLKAIYKQPLDRTPVWLMRQAGRYLPEYRASRQNAGDFLSLCKNKELACEVTLQPLDRFDFDAAILFSDILTIPDAMGLGLRFVQNEGPVFDRPIQSVADIEKLPLFDPNDDLAYVMRAVSTIRGGLKQSNGKQRVPLIGFTGSPWTLATYMIEGGSSKRFEKCKQWIYKEPEAVDLLLQTTATNVTNYLLAQVEAGADALMIFDTWGGILNTSAYQRFSLSPMQKIIAEVKAKHPNVPITVFTKNGHGWLESIADIGADMVAIDWTIDLSVARKRIGEKVALQGNLDPGVLYGSESLVRTETRRVLDAFGNGTGHVFNLGHGIEPGVNPDNVSVLVDEIRSYSPQMHK